MKRLLFILSIFFLVSCSIQKRQYRSGFFIEKNGFRTKIETDNKTLFVKNENQSVAHRKVEDYFVKEELNSKKLPVENDLTELEILEPVIITENEVRNGKTVNQDFRFEKEILANQKTTIKKILFQNSKTKIKKQAYFDTFIFWNWVLLVVTVLLVVLGIILTFVPGFWSVFAGILLLLFVSIFLPISLARNDSYSKLDVYYYVFFPAFLIVLFACIALIAHFYFIIALAVFLALILLIFLIAIVVFVGIEMDL